MLIRKVGGGGFSEVWLARDEKADINVALKIYYGMDGMTMDGIELFRKEFREQSKLNHSNILQVRHYDNEMLVVYPDNTSELYNIPYLELPFCSNGAVSCLTGKMDEEELWRFAQEVVAGLVYLHSRKDKNGNLRPIIHQDIKPANILIGEDRTFLITDFGISVDIRATIRATSKTHDVTERSMTTEYAGKERYPSKDNPLPLPLMASDIWAFGATLYELVTGEVPFGRYGGLTQKESEIKKPNIPQEISVELKEIIGGGTD